MNFRELRVKQGFRTAKDVAIAIDIPLPRVQKWDNGECAPKTKDLAKIANALGVTVDELLKCFSSEEE